MTQSGRRDRRVARVMLVGYIVTGGLMILASWVGISRMQPVVSTTGDSRVQAFGSLLRIDSLANDAAQELYSYLVAGHEEEFHDFRLAVERLAGEKVLYESLARLEANGTDQPAFTNILSSWARFLTFADTLVAEYRQQGSVSEASYSSAERSLDTFFVELDEFIRIKRENLVTIRVQREAIVDETQWQLVLVCAVGLISLFGVGIFVTRRVTSYVRELEQRDANLELLSTALDSTHVGICYTDTSNHNSLIYANRALERITGYTHDELTGKNLDILHGEETNPETVSAIHEAISQGCEINALILNYRKDGQQFWNDLYLSPVREGSGTVSHFVGVMHDVSNRRELESQLQRAQKMEAVGQLAGGVAHDFNNYLTVINGNAELLAMNASDERTRAQARQIIEAGNRSASLTRHLLAFSRRQVMVPQILDLNQVVKDLNPLLTRTLGERISLITVTDDGLGMVSADESQIEQVLLNLVVNARDAMPEGGRITIETRNVSTGSDVGSVPSSQSDDQVMIAVSDTGSGIPHEIRERIFEPFFSTKEGAGSGLGLSTVIGIVEQSGGTIQVHSKPGNGTRVEVYLPRVAGMADTRSPPEAESSSNLEGSVLVVEDETMVRDITCQMVRNMGLSVVAAEDGVQALALLRDNTVDVLLTDVMLPGIDGIELAERAVTLHPSLGVVYMSGYAEDGVLKPDRLDEGIRLLEKPFTEHALRQKLTAVFQ